MSKRAEEGYKNFKELVFLATVGISQMKRDIKRMQKQLPALEEDLEEKIRIMEYWEQELKNEKR